MTKITDTTISRPVSDTYPWYDSLWLENYSRARKIIEEVKPEILDEFESSMRVFHTRENFREIIFDEFFDEEKIGKIRQEINSLKPDQLELHEARDFRRFVVHNNPFFSSLQREITPIISDSLGEPVEVSYNFLSLYKSGGICPMHMDSPEAKWTLDICLDQTTPWPIFFSRPYSWHEITDMDWSAPDWQESVKNSTDSDFRSHTLYPGQAILFSGSSQWHYRDKISEAGPNTKCDLLFFHFIPKNTSRLLNAKNWADIFGVSQLNQLPSTDLSDHLNTCISD